MVRIVFSALVFFYSIFFSTYILASLVAELSGAIQVNNVKEVKRVLTLLRKPQAEKVDEARWLLLAFRRHRYKIAELMLKNGFDASSVSRFGKPLLVEVSGMSPSEPVKMLLKYGANPDAMNKNDNVTALHIAVDRHFLHHVYNLVPAGANVNMRQRRWDDTVLSKLVKSAHYKEIVYVLEHGANVNLLYDGETVLSHAIRDGQQEIVQLLLAHKADPNAGEGFGRPIHAALSSHHLTFIKILVAAGGDIDSMDGNGDTYLIAASRFGRLTEVNILLGQAADVNVANNVGETALMAAAKAGYFAISKILLRYSADTKLKSKDGKMAIDYAHEKYSFNIVKLLE